MRAGESPLCHNFFTPSSVVVSEGEATVGEMRKTIPFRARAPHRHTEVTSYTLRQREGIPYEAEGAPSPSVQTAHSHRPGLDGRGGKAATTSNRHRKRRRGRAVA